MHENDDDKYQILTELKQLFKLYSDTYIFLYQCCII